MSTTTAQQTDLKALADAVLRRNSMRNSVATAPELLVAPTRKRNAQLEQTAADSALAELVEGWELNYNLDPSTQRLAAGDDWGLVLSSPANLRCFASWVASNIRHGRWKP